jgi:pimeloyl-ACP methyl ester carboxylesterase
MMDTKMLRRWSVAAALTILAGAAFATPVSAQVPPQRTLDELKVEAQARADRNAYPLIGLKPDEVREALAKLTGLDRDEWAAAWSAIGERYATKAQAELATAPAQADKDFMQAWRYYSFARWPVPNSPDKEKAYAKALEAFVAHGKLLDPPMEVVHIPFEGKEIIGYVQMPKASGPVPIVVAISGLDSRKEDMAERFQPMLDHGVGYLALDMPGVGQSPIKIAPGADRMLRTALDYAIARPQVDKRKVLVYGGSFGGYWSTLLAVTDKERLRAVVAQSPPVHAMFQSDAVRQAVGNKEYLFDLLPAMMSVYDGATTLDQLAEMSPRISLQAQGFIGKPTAPMLVIGGVLDTQVPISDTDLLLHSGDTPKDAWINPKGGHMGRDTKGWSDPVIFKRITMPWILRQLAASGE